MKNRLKMIEFLEAENTTAYRLFHGVCEGLPGTTVDRYGDVILIQTFREELLTQQELVDVSCLFPEETRILYNPRGGHARRQAKAGELNFGDFSDRSTETVFQEVGLNFEFSCLPFSDPSLFLDFRFARRWIQNNASDLSVLNTFAYTCGCGVAAAVGGARKVVNLDHGSRCLELGAKNAALNNVSMQNVQSDFYPAMRQYAGLGVKGLRAARRGVKYPSLNPETFDLIILDPPTLTKSKWGAVDIVNDYSALAKPALLSLSENGRLLATNHTSQVSMDEWVDVISRNPTSQVEQMNTIERQSMVVDRALRDTAEVVPVGT
ncbi:hypothetical protein CYMTET_19427 [Cymbomonas tetramitiformis]|uniref:S-adenosylmethionine-dependent methyltransferase domain-containing protein n=1 Tax=Cymbomonas tetramitiformis TaxID=36881 RepID=A0AAE0L4Z1_9CHLO|nr:hypothetical protein CYMTET_19427 [Cymbomonas tetramitiformis]